MSDNEAPRYPVSVKAIIKTDMGYALLKNERGEWELPGGKLEYGESPIETVNREIVEELSFNIPVSELVDAWMYHVNNINVLILTYGSRLIVNTKNLRHSAEHVELNFFRIQDMRNIDIPNGYVTSIEKWAKICAT